VYDRERLQLLLEGLTEVEREALVRFYLEEQTPAQIQLELNVDFARLRELQERLRILSQLDS